MKEMHPNYLNFAEMCSLTMKSHNQCIFVCLVFCRRVLYRLITYSVKHRRSVLIIMEGDEWSGVKLNRLEWNGGE